MKRPLLNVRAETAALSGAMPQSPHPAFGQATNRGTIMLRYADRWRFLQSAGLVLLLGLLLALIGIVAHNDILSALGLIGLIAAGIIAIRLDPTQLDSLLARVETECQNIAADYAAQCRQAAAQHTATATGSLQAESQAAIRAGSTSITDLSAELSEIEADLSSAQNDLANRADQQRAAANQLREDYKKERARLNAASRVWKSRYLPAPCRQAARAALTVLQRASEADCAAVQTSACLKSMQEMAQATAGLGRNVGNASAAPATNPETTTVQDDSPWWAGRALPPADALTAEGAQRAHGNITFLRERVLAASSQREDPQTALEMAVDEILDTQPCGPGDVSAYLASLNGDSGAFVGKVFADASPMCPSKSIPGHKRQRKVLAFVCGSGGSTAFKALKERAPDSVGVFGQENSPEEMFLWFEERGLVLAELPEAMSCIETFRKLAPCDQELLITATENDEDITQFHPERPEDQGHPARLLALSLIMKIVSRSGSEQYSFNKRQIGKGWRNATESLRLEQRLAAEIAARLEEAITNDGFAAVVAKLTEAAGQPAVHVPKDHQGEFQAAVQEAIADLQHRAGTHAATR